MKFSPSSKKKLGIAAALAVVSVVFLVVMGIVILNGTDENDDSSTSAKTEQGDGDGDGGGGDDDDDGEDKPDLKTVALERGEGKNATAAVASPSMERPEEIVLRVSAAPKQEVIGTWNVSCGSGNVSDDAFTVTPPHEIKLKIPKQDASCIAGASGQLDKTGRLKLTILRDR
ncbi:MAG: hypothetical protein H0W96_08995 [Solirubrobacterales bacterium]|nr:hypothetical protein [Solirubrobacterales bacterium]